MALGNCHDRQDFDTSATQLPQKEHQKLIFLFNHIRATLDQREADMLEFLSKDLRDGLDAARKYQERRKSKLRVQVGEAVFPVLRSWHDGFVLDGKLSPHLRGIVDVYDGSRHVFQCLIVASVAEAGEIVCEFKTITQVTDKAPLDFWLDPVLPVGLLPKA
jgi:hypothetical protein